MNVTEEMLANWSRPPSETEEDRCRNAVRAVADAVKGEFGNDVDIFLQGSYRNRTNVRRDSDVDIVVRHNKYCFTDSSRLPLFDQPKVRNHYPFVTYTFEEFKSSVHNILHKEFGSDASRENKCIRLSENSYRVKADVVPVFEYYILRQPHEPQHSGTCMFADDKKSEIIYSFPQQHYDNGVAKNGRTAESYKGLVRILKRIRNRMIEEGVLDENGMPSFFLECLVWNMPDDTFQHAKWEDILRSFLVKVYNDMKNPLSPVRYTEANAIKPLFTQVAGRTPEKASTFTTAVWQYLGL